MTLADFRPFLIVVPLAVLLIALRWDRSRRAQLPRGLKGVKEDIRTMTGERIVIIAVGTMGFLYFLSPVLGSYPLQVVMRYAFIASAFMAIGWFVARRKELELRVTYQAASVALVVIVVWLLGASAVQDFRMISAGHLNVFVAQRGPSSRTVPIVATYTFLFAYLVLRRRAT